VGCDHGTHVAGIVAGKSASFSGVAKDANLIAMQVFSMSNTGVIGAYSSDVVKALERVYELRNNYSIAAVNMSLGGGLYTANCDSSASFTKGAIDNLRSVGIATVISSGNDGSTMSIGAPACISSAISVGSVYADAGHNNACRGWNLGVSSPDQLACSSNSSSFLSLLAPGAAINSSVPGSSYSNKSGTSMAAPHVAGAWALYKQKFPQASVTTALRAFEQTGTPVLDPRNRITKPRINVAQALNLSATDLINCGAKCTITMNLGDQLTLTSAAAGTHQFANWSGACAGKQSACTVTVDGNTTIFSAFDTLQVSRAKKIIPIIMQLLED
jgi:subtilisin family serine protease